MIVVTSDASSAKLAELFDGPIDFARLAQFRWLVVEETCQRRPTPASVPCRSFTRMGTAASARTIPMPAPIRTQSPGQRACRPGAAGGLPKRACLSINSSRMQASPERTSVPSPRPGRRRQLSASGSHGKVLLAAKLCSSGAFCQRPCQLCMLERPTFDGYPCGPDASVRKAPLPSSPRRQH